MWQGTHWRLVHADEVANAVFPAFYRLIHQEHHPEWSDLPTSQREQGMEMLTCIERLMRQHLRPTKMNLAALGNVVPHLHWHVIGRFDWDTHYPHPVWGTASRTADEAKVQAIQAKLPSLEADLRQQFSAWQSL